MFTLHIIGEIHNEQEDINYKKIVKQAAEDNKLIYIQEGRPFNAVFSRTEGWYAAHPNIVGIEDLYTYIYANLARIRLLTSKVTNNSRAYGAFLLLKQLQSSKITNDEMSKVQEMIKTEEKNLEKYKNSFQNEYVNITLFLKAISQFIFLEISQIKNHPLKEDLLCSLKTLKKTLIKEYCEDSLISKLLEALKDENYFHETNIQIDEVVTSKFLMDIKDWETVIKNFMLILAEKLNKLEEYKEFKKYLDKELIESLFQKPNMEIDYITPILLDLRNKSYLINIKSLLSNFDKNLPIYAIIGDKHLEQLQLSLDSKYEKFNILYYPLKNGRDKRPQPNGKTLKMIDKFPSIDFEDTIDSFDDSDEDTEKDTHKTHDYAESSHVSATRILTTTNFDSPIFSSKINEETELLPKEEDKSTLCCRKCNIS